MANSSSCVKKIHVLGALIELVEFAYFTGIHEKPANRTLRIMMHTLDGEKEGSQMWFQVKVHSHPAGNAFEEIKRNFTEGYFKHLWTIVKSNEDHLPETCHLWDKLFEQENICRVRHWKVTPPGLTTESIEEKSSSKGWSMYFRVYEDIHEMKCEYLKLLDYLQKLKLVIPSLTIITKLNIEGQVSKTELLPSGFIVPAGSKRLEGAIASNLGCDDNEETSTEEQIVIKPRVGSTYRMNAVQCTGFSTLDSLKVSCVAWLNPPPSTEHLAFNYPISTLKVLFFGPGELPLSTPECNIGNPSFLFDLRDYGMTVADVNHAEEMEAVDLKYKVNATEAVDATAHEVSDGATYQLLILVFLTGTTLPKAQTTDKNLGVLYRSRLTFSSTCSKYRNKIRKAVYTALNKILQNYRAQDQKQTLMESSIPVIEDALTNIVKRSTNEEFRKLCFQSTEGQDSYTFQTTLHKAIWTMSKNLYGVKEPRDSDKTSLDAEPKKNLHGSHKRNAGTSPTEDLTERSEFQPNEETDNPENSAVPNTTLLQIPTEALSAFMEGLDCDWSNSSTIESTLTGGVINQLVVATNNVLTDPEEKAWQYDINLSANCEDAFGTLQYIGDLHPECPADSPKNSSMPVTSSSPKPEDIHRSPGPNWYNDLLSADF